MEDWVRLTLGAPTFSLTVLLAAFLLGLISTVSSCCNLPVIGAIIGYSGALNRDKINKTILLSGLSFMLGTIIALTALGGAVGFISHAAGSALGIYWKLFAGAVMIFLGTVSLNLLPFRLPNVFPKIRVIPDGTPQALLYGLAVGGATTVCSAACNPILPVVLGVATLQGSILWGAAVLGSFAFGYSLPLALIMIGLSLGFTRWSAAFNKYAAVIKRLAGAILLGVGFYLLLTAGS